MGFKVNSSAAPGTGVPGDGLTFEYPSPPPPPPPPPEGFPNAPPTPGTDAAGAQTAVGSRWEVAIIALAAGLALLACLIGCGCLQFYTKAAENRRVHPRTAEQASAKAKAEAKAKRDAEAFKAAAPKVHALPQLARAWEGIDGRSAVSVGAASASAVSDDLVVDDVLSPREGTDDFDERPATASKVEMLMLEETPPAGVPPLPLPKSHRPAPKLLAVSKVGDIIDRSAQYAPSAAEGGGGASASRSAVDRLKAFRGSARVVPE